VGNSGPPGKGLFTLVNATVVVLTMMLLLMRCVGGLDVGRAAVQLEYGGCRAASRRVAAAMASARPPGRPGKVGGRPLAGSACKSSD
jgi:hypothetical protein